MRDEDKTKAELISELREARQRVAELEESEAVRRKMEKELKGSKEFLDNVINALDDPVFVKDEEHRRVILNDAACEVIGRAREELIGKTDYDLFPRKQADVFWEKDEAVFNTGETNVNEEEITWHGKLHTILTKKSLLRDSRSGKSFVVGIIRDITERKQVEDALRKSEEKYRQLIENLQEGIWVIDKDSYTTFANPPMAEMLGYTVEEMQGRHLFSFMDERAAEVCKRKLERRKQGVKEQHDFEFLRKDGTRLYAALETAPIRDDEGNYAGAIAGVIDITERRNAEKALRESEERYRLLAENATDIIWTADMNLRVTYISPAVKRVRGYDVEEAMSQTLRDVLTPASYDLTMKLFEEELALEKTGQGDRFRSRAAELELGCKDGSKVWTETTVTFLRDKGGRPFGIVGVTRDISERKRAEDALRETNETLRALIQASPVAILSLDGDGKVTMWSPAAERMFGWKEEEVLGKLLPIVPEDKQEEFHALRQRVLCGEVFTGIEVRRQKRDGSSIDISISAAALCDARGESIGVMALLEDITERKRAEIERRRLEQQLAQAQKMEALGTLAGGIAHEFNNINAAIIGYADLTLQTEKLSESVRRNLEVVRTSAARGADLTKSLLVFSGKEMGEKKLVRVKDVVDEVLRVTEKEFTSEGIELAVEHSMKVPQVVANAGLLTQVVMNLVINARHAMLKSAVKRLIIQTGVEKGRAFIRVKDTGCGIRKEDVSRLFEPFFTTKGSLAGGEVYDGKTRGTGLGLSVCHSIIKGHGGEIKVRSRAGTGASFTVHLPAASSGKVERRKVEKETKVGVSRILVVDDEEAIADLLVDILGHAGYATDGFTDPREAFEALANGEYSLAFIDLQMPEMSGEDFIRRINRLSAARRPLKVILTGRLDVYERNYERLGVFATVTKPFTTQRVLEIVGEGLSARGASSGEGGEGTSED